MEKHFMNKAMGRHFGEQSAEPAGDTDQESGQHHAPHIHIHPHHDESGKHVKTTVHVMHHDGRHEKHEHAANDTEGVKSHIDEHYGQDHGGSSGEGDEDNLLTM